MGKVQGVTGTHGPPEPPSSPFSCQSWFADELIDFYTSVIKLTSEQVQGINRVSKSNTRVFFKH